MERRSNSIAVVTVSIIALLASIGAAVYFIMRYLNKRKKDCYDFVDCYDPDDIYDFSDDYSDCGCDDCCDCIEKPEE